MKASRMKCPRGIFFFKVALEATKGTKTISELASEHGVHPNQISDWKRRLLEEGANLFQRNGIDKQLKVIYCISSYCQ
jgi:transposase-like protein